LRMILAIRLNCCAVFWQLLLLSLAISTPNPAQLALSAFSCAFPSCSLPQEWQSVRACTALPTAA
jgi:hypothetical protein